MNKAIRIRKIETSTHIREQSVNMTRHQSQGMINLRAGNNNGNMPTPPLKWWDFDCKYVNIPITPCTDNYSTSTYSTTKMDEKMMTRLQPNRIRREENKGEEESIQSQNKGGKKMGKKMKDNTKDDTTKKPIDNG
jgi:hypothetical protein